MKSEEKSKPPKRHHSSLIQSNGEKDERQDGEQSKLDLGSSGKLPGSWRSTVAG